jgi:hypothetical protein
MSRFGSLGSWVLGWVVLAVCVFLWTGKAWAPQQADDPLTPQLRARVERLEVEAREPTTDLGVLRERMDVLIEWADAFALAGGRVPVDFTYNYGICNRALRGSKDRWAASYSAALAGPDGVTPDRISDFITRSVREFSIKESSPNAVGTLAISDPGPFVAGEYATVELSYEVGDIPMKTGGGIMLAHNQFIRFQVDHPARDNHVTLRCSNPAVLLEKVEPWGEWATRLTRPLASYRLVEGTLSSGDTITVTYGDRSGGSKGMLPRPWASDENVLPFYVDLEGTGTMLAPVWPTFGVSGRPEASFVNGVVPSIVAPAEPFSLAVRSEDRFKNPISGRAPDYEVVFDGRRVATVPAADRAVSVVEDLRIEEPGIYRFEIRSPDGTITANTNPVWVRADPPYRIYWGDTHGHIGLADGQGSADGYFRFGRDFARLDFLTLSEHDIWTDAAEWRLLQDKTRQYFDPGKFTTFLGYEWTARITSGGHHNVYFRTSEGREQVGNHKVVNLDELYAGLRRLHDPRDVLIIPHVHRPGDWRKSDGAMERLAEIQSGHGTFEWYGNRYLANGFEVGFIGSSDNHSTQPGYSVGKNRQLGGLAAVIAADNTPDALFDAMRSRSCYATTGERIIVDVSLDGTPMGRRAPDAGKRTISCRVMGTEPIDAIDVVKNGDVVYTKRFLAGELGSRVRVQVEFFSSSEVLVEYTYPRGQRDWRGTMDVGGARLVDFARPWFYSPTSFDLERDAGNPNRLTFATNTRGRAKAVILELDGASADTEIRVNLQAGRENPRVGTGDDRRPQPYPAEDLLFRLGDLVEGPGIRELWVARHLDTVKAQLVPGDAALDQEFSYTDRGDPRPGDYYYVRVRQVDGSVAWSSPFWAGVAETKKESQK